jgi:CMD domain protein
MSAFPNDVIDHLAGIAAGSHLDRVRGLRAQARENAQNSFRALFETDETEHMSGRERFAVAAFIAGLHEDRHAELFYVEGAAGQDGLGATLAAEAARGAVSGPYGAYPSSALAAENTAGLVYRVLDGNRATLGHRLAAALEHVHLLVFRPREASAAALQALLDAGWSATGIVTLSQLVAFLSFQLRVVAGLRALAAAAV